MLLTTLESNRVACVRCDRRGPGGGGPCACTVDAVDIIVHTEADYCPHPAGPRYGGGDKPAGWDELPKAGDPGAPQGQRPIPRERWPRIVRTLARHRAEGERGVGDTAKRVLHRMGGDALAWLFRKVTGRDCGCADRRARLNAMYPY